MPDGLVGGGEPGKVLDEPAQPAADKRESNGEEDVREPQLALPVVP
jgi:hypothetical protein